MLRFQAESNGGRIEKPWKACHLDSKRTRRLGYYETLLNFLSLAMPRWLSRKWSQQPDYPITTTLADENATSILYENLKTLLHQDEEAYCASSPRVTVAVPVSLTDLQACPIISAIAHTGKSIISLEHPPGAAFTALGFPLCRISSEWAPCQPPGRIMTLHYTRDALTAALMSTPLYWWMHGKVIYEINENLGNDRSQAIHPAYEDTTFLAMAQWIDTFAEKNKPDRVILLGPFIDQPAFKKAVSISRISSLIVGYPSDIDPEHTVVLGTAKVAKDNLESQNEDCLEDDECEEIRRKADEMAGSSEIDSSARTGL